MSRPSLPPFTAETAAEKARLAEDVWNTRDPTRSHLRTRKTGAGETAPSSLKATMPSFNSSPVTLYI
jgi:hypothetical protein